MAQEKKPGFFDDIVDNEAEKKTIKYRGKDKTVWFRLITAAERIVLLKGQTMQAGGEGKPSFTIDMADSAERNAKLVEFSCVDGEGKQIFASVNEVKRLPDDLINVLYKHAAEVNKEEFGEAGNA